MFFSGATLSPLTVVLRCNKTYTESSAPEKDPEKLTWMLPVPDLWGGA